MQKNQMSYIRETKYGQLYTNLKAGKKLCTEIFWPSTLIPT